MYTFVSAQLIVMILTYPAFLLEGCICYQGFNKLYLRDNGLVIDGLDTGSEHNYIGPIGGGDCYKVSI